MSKGKVILGGLAALAVGGFLVYTGVREYRNSKRLVNEGKSVDAKVADKDTSTGRRGRKSYYLTVQFKTEAGQPVDQRVQVSSSDFDSANVGNNVKVHYLADDPSICQVGNKAEVKWTTLAAGAFMALVGGFSVVRQGTRDSDSSGQGTGEVADTADHSSSDGSGDSGDIEEAA